jgi:hypothetical protein
MESNMVSLLPAMMAPTAGIFTIGAVSVKANSLVTAVTPISRSYNSWGF